MSINFPAVFAWISPEIDLVDVMNQAVQNGTRQGGVTDDFVKLINGYLASGVGEATSVAVFQNP
ncbi:hypothetical protein SAMN05216203_3009 [Marinobacter daqiaonensis]|uniref:Uncharacterized protein n=1 Tax=Marinobacter daqiaonensis TaxID=650891 RepID=A0A1I6JGU8_9GAMM|nr:hypothetical protein SAMN05216203_3009 [Marinobacter daqiaonensis]